MVIKFVSQTVQHKGSSKKEVPILALIIKDIENTNPSPSLVIFFLTIHLSFSTTPSPPLLHLYTEPRLMSSAEVKTYRQKEKKEYKHGIYWRCSDQSCTGRLITKEEEVLPEKIIQPAWSQLLKPDLLCHCKVCEKIIIL